MSEKKIEPLPDIEAAQEQARIIEYLDELKKDIIHGRVTQVAIFVANENGQEGFESRSLVYPDDIGPMELMGLAKFFEAEISHMVFGGGQVLSSEDEELPGETPLPGKLH